MTDESRHAVSLPTALSTCAIVVTYNPDVEFGVRVGQVSAQFPRVIIIDNGSETESCKTLLKLVDDSKLKIVCNPTNLGIAEALNQGIAQALLEGFDWGVTLDQDTQVFPDLLETLIDVHTRTRLESVIVGGNYRNINKQKNFIDCDAGTKPFRDCKTLITAGTLIPLRMARRIGGFRADYFIDSVDHEFCLRARANGFRIVISCKPVMSQNIGSGIVNASVFSRFASFNHAPVRKYYIARNTLVTARDYFFREPVWACRQVWRLLSDFASIILFENGKRRKIKAFMMGIAHGLVRKMGPIEPERANVGDRPNELHKGA